MDRVARLGLLLSATRARMRFRVLNRQPRRWPDDRAVERFWVSPIVAGRIDRSLHRFGIHARQPKFQRLRRRYTCFGIAGFRAATYRAEFQISPATWRADGWIRRAERAYGAAFGGTARTKHQSNDHRAVSGA